MFFIFWIVWVLMVLAIPIYPIFQNRAMKAATDRFGKQLQQNPVLGKCFAQTLYKPVGWIAFDADLDTQNLTARFDRLPNRVGDFLIHYSQMIGEASYLFVTTVKYYHPPGVTLRNVVTSVTYNLNFVVQLEVPKKQVMILSDLYTTLVDKNLRADFAQAFLTMLAE